MSADTESGDAKPSSILAEDFLAILVCPEDKTPVKQAPQDVVDAINKRMKEEKLLNRGGDKVNDPIDGGLLREDGKYLYPIREGIPIMLIEEAIPMGD